MKKKNKTGKALGLSIFATFLCVALLFGVTYAWFTSTVDSGNNVIKTGAFDVEVKYNKVFTDEWQTFETGILFADADDDVTLLPGESATRYIKFINKCEYPVRFDLVLPQFVQKDVATSFEFYYDDDVDAALTSTSGMTLLNTLGGLNPESAAKPTKILSVVVDGKDDQGPKEHVVAVSLKLPENYSYSAANAEVLWQNFVFRVIATQYNVPHDSVEATAPVAQTLTVDNVTVVVPASAVVAGDIYSLIVTDVNTSVAGEFSCDITLNKNGEAVEAGSTVYTVKINIGPEKVIRTVDHNGVLVEDYTYDPTTGILEFVTTSFSPFTITFYDYEDENICVVSDVSELTSFIQTVNAGSIEDPIVVLEEGEYQFSGEVELKKSVKFIGVSGETVLKGYEVTSDYDEAFFINASGNENQTFEFRNITFDHFGYYKDSANGIKATKGITSGITYSGHNPATTEVILDSCEFIGTGRDVINASSTLGCAGSITIKNCVFDVTDRVSGTLNVLSFFGKSDSALNVTIEGCEFAEASEGNATWATSAIACFGNCNMSVSDCTFTACQVALAADNTFWVTSNINADAVTLNTDIQLDNNLYDNCYFGYFYQAFVDSVSGIDCEQDEDETIAGQTYHAYYSLEYGTVGVDAKYLDLRYYYIPVETA